MTHRKTPIFLAFVALFAIAITGIAQQSATEAPAAFDTPTLGQNLASQSVSNGIPEPPGDTFALDQQRFERRNGVDDGLGPVFNATAAPTATRTPSPEAPAGSPKSAPATSTRPARSSTRPSRSTTAPARLPAVPSSTTAPSVRRLTNSFRHRPLRPVHARHQGPAA